MLDEGYIQDDKIIFVKVVSQGVKQKIGFLLNFPISAQDKEYIEP